MKKYPEYKESEIEWVGKVPKHWKVLKIGRLSVVKRGASPRPIDDIKYFDVNGEYAWVRISDVTASGMYLETTTQRLSELGQKESVKLEPGEIFLSIAGSVGKPIISKIKCCIHDGFVYFPEYKENKKFLYYIFASGQLYSGLGKLGTQLNLNTYTVSSISIPLPPRTEQDLISFFLDRETSRIDKLIEKKQKQIELLQEKRSALISHVVTKGLDPNVKMKDSGVEWLGEVPEHWEIVKIKRVSKINNGSTPKSSISEYWDGDINWVTPEDLGNLKNHTIYETRRKISEKGYLSCGTTIVPEGSIVLSTRAPIGHIAIAGNPLCCNQGCRLLTINENQNNKYFYYLLYICKSALESYGQGSTFMELSRNNLESFVISVPPIQEQNVIVNLLDNETSQIDNLIDRIEFSIEKIQEYRTSLISAAVTGKIDVRNEIPETDTDEQKTKIAAESVQDYNK